MEIDTDVLEKLYSG
jgi:hypothetical protein